MCELVGEVRDTLGSIVATLDPEVLTAADAVRLVENFTAIKNLAATGEMLAARRVDECGRWAREGDRSATHWLARRSGTSVSQARSALETAERLDELPGVDAAVRAGELSAPQAAAIADAAAANPDAEDELLTAARKESLPELRERCARTKAAALPDPDAHHRSVHAARHVRRRTTAEGGGELVHRSTLEELAEIWAVLEGYGNRAFKAARTEGRREPAEAYLADGLLAMARAAAGTTGTTERPVPAKVIVRIDWDALIRGWPIEGETSEIPGLGQVPVSVVLAMVESGDAFLAAVVTKGVDVATVAHLGRRPTAFQVTALQWRDPTCVAQGCKQSARLEVDHRQEWAKTKITLVRLMDHLCGWHHDKKTRDDWALVEGTGKRPMVPPDDPRHPRNRYRRAPPGAA